MVYKIEYSANNSGGNWWIEDEHWYTLEKNGWKIDWYDETYTLDKDGKRRFLGSLARGAKKTFYKIEDAVKEFESLTGLCLSDEGCNCCGPPHSFIINNHELYISGSDFVDYIDESKDDIIKRLRR